MNLARGAVGEFFCDPEGFADVHAVFFCDGSLVLRRDSEPGVACILIRNEQ